LSLYVLQKSSIVVAEVDNFSVDADWDESSMLFTDAVVAQDARPMTIVYFNGAAL